MLCPVIQNLTRVCPPLHVSSAANHDTHVRRVFAYMVGRFQRLSFNVGYHKTLGVWPRKGTK